MRHSERGFTFCVLLPLLLTYKVLCEETRSVFISHPVDKQVVQHAGLIISCNTILTSNNATWYKDGSAIIPGSAPYTRFSAQREMEIDRVEFDLFIMNTQLSDSGSYQCRIKDPLTSLLVSSKSAQVTIVVPPRSPPTLHDVVHGEITMQSGVNTTLRCDVQGVTPPAMLSWYLNGVQINQSSGLNQSGDVALEKDDDLFDTSILLTLLPSSDYYGSNVSCRMSHVAFGHALFTNASLDVTYPPDITLIVVPEQEWYYEQQPVYVSCSADANPDNITFNWSCGNISDEGGVPECNLTAGSGHQDFMCEAANSEGSAVKTYTIKTGTAPENVTILGSSLDSFHTPGDVFILRCLADAFPPVTSYSWNWNDTKGENVTVTLSTGDLNGAEIICIAKNVIGNSTATYILNVTETETYQPTTQTHSRSTVNGCAQETVPTSDVAKVNCCGWIWLFMYTTMTQL